MSRKERVFNAATAARAQGAPMAGLRVSVKNQELPPDKTVTARRFCDQQEMSSQVATGRSLPKLEVRMRFAATPWEMR